MPGFETHSGADPPSDNDRLIAIIQLCFHTVVQKHDEHLRAQQDQAERIHKALEALKPPVPLVPDKKTAFWDAYMKLADEHDKEFKERYGTDLDTALIFAGLFSAVSSAFIIQMQAQLMAPPGPSRIIIVSQILLYTSLFTTLLVALLAVLGKQWIMHYQAAGSRGPMQERGLERQRKLNGVRKWRLETVLQMFPLLLQLALLLFSTALSIYLWTVHHGIAIVVVALTLLGFAVYMSQLVSAIISPDSPFQTPLAPFLIQSYSVSLRILKATAVQLRNFVNSIPTSWSRSIKSGTILPYVTSHIETSRPPSESSASSESYFYSPTYFPQPSPEVPAVVWVLETSTDPDMISTTAEIAADLQWPLDVDLTLPITRLVESFGSCLELRWQSPRTLGRIRKGMTHRASNYARAYCALRAISRVSTCPTWAPSIFGTFYNPIEPETDTPIHSSPIFNLAQILRLWPEYNLALNWEDPVNIHLALHVFPSHSIREPLPLENLEHFLVQFGSNKARLDQSGFANYLCCVNSFLAPASPQLVAQTDKRPFRDDLLIRLFKGLQVGTIDAHLTAQIINTTAHLANNLLDRTGRTVPVVTEACQFCSAFVQLGGPLDALVSAAMLARFETIEDLSRFSHEVQLLDVDWVYVAMEHVQRSWEEKMTDADRPHDWDDPTTLAMESLLQLLIFGDIHRRRPPETAFHIILRALSMGGTISFAAFLILHQAASWFLDPDLKSAMQPSFVWSDLGRTALQFPHFPDTAAHRYILLGAKVAELPEWKAVIYTDLPTWLAAFIAASSAIIWGGTMQETTQAFVSVLRSVWVPDIITSQQAFVDENEDSWALAIAALSRVWGNAEYLATLAPDGLVRLAQCTVRTSLVVDYPPVTEISPDCRAIFSLQLGNTLVQAAERARTTIPNKDGQISSHLQGSATGYNKQHAQERFADFLEALGKKIGTEFQPRTGEVQLGGSTKIYRHWTELKDHFLTELDGFENSLSAEFAEL